MREAIRYGQYGFSTIMIMVMIVAMALVIVNFTGSVVTEEDVYGTPTPAPVIGGSCCNTGDGDECQVVSGETVTWKGHEYGLLKSDVAFTEGVWHLVYATAPDETVDLHGEESKVLLNDSQRINHGDQPDCPAGTDLLWKDVNLVRCFGVEDDSLIYVCKDNCEASIDKSKFDAYYRTDLEIPDVISNCDKSQLGRIYGNASSAPVADVLVCPSPSAAKDALQLEACEVIRHEGGGVATPWLSPYCKPAIYLYPTEQTDVNVQVKPVGKMTLTIPKYPATGWQVTAYPNGQIIDPKEGDFDYLYYEARIPDKNIEFPTKGFVRKPAELTELLKELMPKLGLNEKESSEFISYWVKALPSAPYYFVGVISPENLDQIAPLTINPQPDKIIRVTIYFQALEGPQNVEAPVIQTPQRDGFTVVEWGGIFKKDPKYPFSCFM